MDPARLRGKDPTTDIDEVVLNTKFSHCRDKLLFQGKFAKAKKAEILHHRGIFRIKTWPGSGWKNNKYEKRQLYLANGLGHVEGSLHQLQGGVLQVGSSETVINIIST